MAPTPPAGATASSTQKTLEKVTIRFAGDSGDGMQIMGGQFTNTTALLGNDLSTFPDFPAERRNARPILSRTVRSRSTR